MNLKSDQCTAKHPDLVKDNNCRLDSGHEGFHELDGQSRSAWSMSASERQAYEVIRRARSRKSMELKEQSAECANRLNTETAVDLGHVV